MQQPRPRSSTRPPSLAQQRFITVTTTTLRSFGRALRRHKRLALASGLLLVAIALLATLLSQNTPGPVYASAPQSNEGLTFDNATSAGNFDGSGNSYSETALSGFGIFSNTSVPILGITFPWPKVASGVADNWVSGGQVLPLASPTSGTTLGILGAASNGQSSGTATVTYTDSSTQTFTLTFSDWTLHAGTLQPAAADTIVAETSYRNTKTGHQTVNTYLFYTSVTLDPSKTVQSLTLPSSLAGGALHVFSFGVLTPSATSDWTEYLGNAARTGFNGAESTITPANASGLSKKWTTTGKDGITAQPVVANGQIFWGSWDGVLHDTPVGGGHDVWDTPLGITTDGSCDPTLAGLAATASAAIATEGGVSTLYIAGGGTDSVGGGNVYMYAVNASNGAVLWKTVIGSSPHDFPWSSPVLYNGSVYYGMSSFGDCPLVRGRVIKMDATTGAIQATFYATKSGCSGDGVTSSPAIDPNGMMYFATGNPGNCGGQSGDYAESMVELNLNNNMSFVASWEIPKSQQNSDSDFLAAPTVFTATINGVATEMVGVVNKNAIYYALNAAKIASGAVWEDQLGPGSECPQCGTAGIAPSAWDGRVLYLGGPAGTINGKSCAGSLQAVNPATGGYLWRDCLGSSVLGAVMAIPGVVFANHGRSISAYNAGNGALLFTYVDSSSSSNFWGAASVADGWLYDGNMDGTFYAFTVPGGGTPTPTPTPPPPTPTCTSTPPPLSLSNLVVNDSANAGSWSVQANIQSGVVQYGDRGYTISSLPSQVAGAAWVETANTSKAYTGNTIATFSINQQATVYVALDTRDAVPSWMSSWTKTSLTLTDNQASGMNTFVLYAKTFGAGQVSLGPNDNGNNLVNMYTVIVLGSGTCGGPPPPTPTPTPPPTPTPTPTSTSGLQLSNLVVNDSANAGSWSVQAGLASGKVQYGDRGYTLVSVPSSLAGAAWVETANTSKAYTGNTIATFSINQQATVYVALDTRDAVPSWMSSWTKTSLTLTDNQASGMNTFVLYAKTFGAGQVSLGPNDNGNNLVNMYTVIVQSP